MYEVDWNEWKQRREFVEKMKKEQRQNLRNLLESDLKEIKISLKDFVEMFEDDEWKSDCLEIMEEALMKIASGDADPQKIALDALKKYNGDG